MEKIYLALVETPGFFAGIIRRVIGINYIHVVLSMDAELTQAYSVGRRDPRIPLIAGYEKEETAKILNKFPNARYQISAIECTAETKKNITRELLGMYEYRYHYHYCVMGLPFLLINKEFYQFNHFTCSSFVAKILEEHGMRLFHKHFSLVTPRDFYELPNREIIYEGYLRDYQVPQETSQSLEVVL